MSQSSESTSAIDRYVAEAATLVGAGRYVEAVEKYKQALALDRAHPRARQEVVNLCGKLFQQLLAQGDGARALDYLSIAASVEPSLLSPQDHLVLATYHAASGRPGEAIERCRTAITIDPMVQDAYLKLSELLVAEGKIEEALRTFQQLLAHRPELAQCSNKIHVSLSIPGKHGRLSAIKEELSYKLIREHDELNAVPEELKRGLLLANHYALQGYFNEAVREYSIVLEAKSDLGIALYNLGALLTVWGDASGDHGKLRQSLSIFHHLVSVRSTWPEAHCGIPHEKWTGG